MKIASTAHMNASPAVAWEAFHNEAILAHTIPGVESFEDRGEGAYDIVLTMGVAAIKGTYKGQVAFSQEKEPESFVLSVKGAGGPGTIGADVAVQLSPAADGGTNLEWEADAVLGGAIGGVGQRMLSGVAKRIATKFFKDIDDAIANPPKATDSEAGPAEAANPPAAGDASAGEGSAAVAAAGPRVVPAPAHAVGAAGTIGVTAGAVRGSEFFAGAVVGAGAALIGVCVGLLAGRQ